MSDFNGTDCPHFFRLENPEDLQAQLKSIYKIFTSTIRSLQMNGHEATLTLFPDEYTTMEGAQAGGIPEACMLENCITFANRNSAEKLWKQNCRILEIGVGNGNHAVSMIKSTNASEYIGIDINLSQINDTSKVELYRLASLSRVSCIQGDSLQILKKMTESHKKFDVIYIDANHWHHFISQELNFAKLLLDSHGRIVVNDYVCWFIGSMEPCGVQKATINFLRGNLDFKIDYFVINDCDLSMILVN